MRIKPYQQVNRQRYRLTDEGAVEIQLSQDIVISEEPLHIVLHWTCPKTNEQLEKTLMVTMRTPGDDDLLVTGLLLSNAVINNVAQIQSIETTELNQCDVILTNDVVVDWKALTRHFISHSGCGICGTSNLNKLAHTFHVAIDETTHWLSLSTLFTLPSILREQQSLFTVTGGVHSAGIFDVDNCLSIKEDVGRHNAVDKVIGDLLQKESLSERLVLMLSGRISFELMQKAVAAKIPVVVAIGAPSSLAVAVAKQFNITLIGFVRENTCNVYHGDFRLISNHKS